jgi:hypothetical protein
MTDYLATVKSSSTTFACEAQVKRLQRDPTKESSSKKANIEMLVVACDWLTNF